VRLLFLTDYRVAAWIRRKIARLTVRAGGLKVICPTFQAEVSQPDKRGQAVGLHGTFFVGGISAALFVGFGCYYLESPQLQWRLVFALQLLFPIILALATIWLPESPRWLVAQQRDEEAFKTLCRLHSSPGDDEHIIAKEEMLAIQAQLHTDGEYDVSFVDLLKRPSTRKRIILACALVVLGQSTGINVVYSFMVNLLPSLGVTGSMPLLINAVYNTVASLMNSVGAVGLDRLGRRPMIITGFVSGLSPDFRVIPLMAGRSCCLSFSTYRPCRRLWRNWKRSRLRYSDLLPLLICDVLRCRGRC